MQSGILAKIRKVPQNANIAFGVQYAARNQFSSEPAASIDVNTAPRAGDGRKFCALYNKEWPVAP